MASLNSEKSCNMPGEKQPVMDHHAWRPLALSCQREVFVCVCGFSALHTVVAGLRSHAAWQHVIWTSLLNILMVPLTEEICPEHLCSGCHWAPVLSCCFNASLNTLLWSSQHTLNYPNVNTVSFLNFLLPRRKSENTIFVSQVNIFVIYECQSWTQRPLWTIRSVSVFEIGTL